MLSLVDSIWLNYDADKSGTLDKEETGKFVKDYMTSIGFQDAFNEDIFSHMFNDFDDDGSGTLEKHELI